MPLYQAGSNVAVAPATTLSGSITASQTTIVVADATTFPTAPPFYPLILDATVAGVQHTEYVLVTAKNGTTLTVVRANEDASRYPAYAFPSGATVDLGLTSALLNNALSRRPEPVSVLVAHPVEPLVLGNGDYVTCGIYTKAWSEIVVAQGLATAYVLFDSSGEVVMAEMLA